MTRVVVLAIIIGALVPLANLVVASSSSPPSSLPYSPPSSLSYSLNLPILPSESESPPPPLLIPNSPPSPSSPTIVVVVVLTIGARGGDRVAIIIG